MDGAEAAAGHRARRPCSRRSRGRRRQAAEPKVAGRGAATWHVCSLQPSASRDRQQDPRLCAAPPRAGATTIGSAKRCRLGDRGGFAPCLHPLSYLQSILGGKLSSACHPACRGDAEWPLSPACGLLSVLERRGAVSARPARDAPAAKMGQ